MMTNVSFARPSTSIAEIILPATGVLAIDDLDCLADRLERANTDEALRVLVVRSAADVFSSGADPAELAAIDDLAGLSATVTRFFEALIGCDKIMIAAVDGPCTGLGITMLLHFDTVLATDAARFSAPFVELGLVPEGASPIGSPTRFPPSKPRHVGDILGPRICSFSRSKHWPRKCRTSPAIDRRPNGHRKSRDTDRSRWFFSGP